MDISIIVPTMNRPKMLLRLIRYFDSVEFGGKILIGDSSDAAIFQEADNALENYRNRLDILHLYLPGRSVAAAVKELNVYVNTRFVCLVPDDDFVVPKTMAKCIQFLDRHLDYVAAHGFGALITSPGDPAAIDDVYFYKQTVADDGTAETRLSKHLEHYSVSLFSVYRVDTWHRMFIDIPTSSELPQCCDKAFVDELLPCCLSVIYGKIKQIDGLHVVRQGHGGRYLLPTWFLWLTNANWRPSYLYFRNRLAQAISSEDRIAMSDAESIVDRSFATYLKRWIAKEEPRLHWFRKFLHWLRKFARKSQALRSIWHALNDIRDWIQPGRRLSLAYLMNPSSPYHEEFLPVFNAVTRVNVGENEVSI